MNPSKFIKYRIYFEPFLTYLLVMAVLYYSDFSNHHLYFMKKKKNHCFKDVHLYFRSMVLNLYEFSIWYGELKAELVMSGQLYPEYFVFIDMRCIQETQI